MMTGGMKHKPGYGGVLGGVWRKGVGSLKSGGLSCWYSKDVSKFKSLYEEIA